MILFALLAIVVVVALLAGPRAVARDAARDRPALRAARRPAPPPRPLPRPTPDLLSLSAPRADAMPATSHGLEFGRAYTRGEIHTLLGGGLQDYLPHVGGRVVAGCFNLRLNPHAPFVVLPGFGPAIQRWAYVFAAQEDPVPCFLKRGTSNVWEYVGDYRVRELSEDADEITEWGRLAGRGTDDVSMVLHLEGAAA